MSTSVPKKTKPVDCLSASGSSKWFAYVQYPGGWYALGPVTGEPLKALAAAREEARRFGAQLHKRPWSLELRRADLWEQSPFSESYREIGLAAMDAPWMFRAKIASRLPKAWKRPSAFVEILPPGSEYLDGE